MALCEMPTIELGQTQVPKIQRSIVCNRAGQRCSMECKATKVEASKKPGRGNEHPSLQADDTCLFIQRSLEGHEPIIPWHECLRVFSGPLQASDRDHLQSSAALNMPRTQTVRRGPRQCKLSQESTKI
mmetsp:Transcript_10959/g.67781  ORF Transcript_10959/g.67781 Transcript_10959/m.67781 type:complete len:128 (+) Transcript_10959:212-595(+)